MTTTLDLELLPENKELDRVVGGGYERIPLDPDRKINGWSYTELHSVLCWTYESYFTGTKPCDYAKYLTVDVANSFISSVHWDECLIYDYPEFIDEAMYRIWCPYAWT